MLLRLASRNILRNKSRSIISLLAIATGVISLILAGGFIEDTVHQVRESYIRDFLGHLRIYKSGFRQQGLLHPFDYMISDPQQMIAQLNGIKHVRYAAPRLSFGGLVSTGDSTLSVTVEGLDPTIETSQINTARLDAGRFLENNNAYEILLGKGLAKAMQAKVGDSLVLVTNTQRGALNALDFTVQGVFGTADKAYDDHVVRIPLGTAQKLLRTQDVQALVLFLDKTSNTDEVKSELEASFKKKGWDYELVPWYGLEEADYILKVISFYRRIFLVLQFIILMVVTLGISNTMNMAVLERLGEVGTMMALGTPRSGVLRLFVLEGLMLGLLGGIAGSLGGLALGILISRIGIPMPTAPGTTISWTAHIAIVPHIMALAFGLAIMTALVSSAWPAFKASRLDIAEGLRHNI